MFLPSTSIVDEGLEDSVGYSTSCRINRPTGWMWGRMTKKTFFLATGLQLLNMGS